ncbi:MAG TPA: LytTR family DNA-binding domain-containing protein [Edaphobacter sp.]|nr:LytTR family DNA-binding domain-containing protein [Edaphobacter sp.]
MRLKTIVADDEPLARERLKLLISEDTEIELIAECRNGKEAIDQLRSSSADLLFLDIQMPGSGGFEVIEAIGAPRMPPTVFVTAHREFAVKAFAVEAVDYLTKPVEKERLSSTLLRVNRRILENSASLTQERLNQVITALRESAPRARIYQERFMVRDGTKEVLVPVSEIEWIEAADYYVCLHVGSRSYMLRESIKQLGAMLDPARFVRIHRSVMVRIDQVREIHRDGETEYFVVLTSGQRLKMSKAGWKNLVTAHGARSNS